MTGTITQRIPPYIAGAEPIVATFESVSGLLDISFVRQWSLGPDPNGDPFHRYSYVCEETTGDTLLMAEFAEGTEWWVVGKLDLPDLSFISGLPAMSNFGERLTDWGQPGALIFLTPERPSPPDSDDPSAPNA